jgi:hypothetical protein
MLFHKAEALQAAYDKACRLSVCLSGTYDGPLVVAGGWVRDQALGFTPKDCDVFIDGGLCTNTDQALQIAHLLGTPGRQFQSYGTWASDVDHITQVATGDMPLDLVVLRREAMVKNGYLPDAQQAGSVLPHVSFLRAVLKRLDLRVNGVGACMYGGASLPEFDADVASKMLVLQHSRAIEETDDREDKRLLRLLGGKFQGWSTWAEQADGSITPYKPGTVTIG